MSYTFEDFSMVDLDMVKEMYEDGLTDPEQLAIEQDLPVETINQMLDCLRKNKQID